MRIRTAWVQSPNVGEMPTMVAAVDEYTEDAWGGIPDFYAEDCKRASDGDLRELFITIPDDAVTSLWAVPTTLGYDFTSPRDES